MTGLARLMQPFLKIRETTKTELMKKYSNVHLIPQISKVVISMCVSEATKNNKLVLNLKKYFRSIVQQEPVYVYAKTSNATFHLREGMLLGLKATLRNNNMLYFLEKVVYYVLPRINNFAGLTSKNLDGNGNLNIGVADLRSFYELKRDQFDSELGFRSKYGLNISIQTTASTNEQALELFQRYNFPFIQKAGGVK